MSVLVFGGSRGIGRAISVGLAAPGVDVFINYFGPDEEAEEAKRLVEEEGARAVLVPGDISTPEGASSVVAKVASETERIDVLVHCAVLTVSGPILNADPVTFRKAVDVNAMSLLYAVQSWDVELIDFFLEAGADVRIVNDESVSLFRVHGAVLRRLAAEGARFPADIEAMLADNVALGDSAKPPLPTVPPWRGAPP